MNTSITSVRRHGLADKIYLTIAALALALLSAASPAKADDNKHQ